MGGSGTRRSARIAATYADEFNLSSSSPDTARQKFADLDAACTAVGRDPASLARSTMAGVLVGRDEAEVARRKADLLAAFGNDAGGDDWFDAREPRWILGTPDQARAMVVRFAEAGAERIMLQDFIPRDLDMIDLMPDLVDTSRKSGVRFVRSVVRRFILIKKGKEAGGGDEVVHVPTCIPMP